MGTHSHKDNDTGDDMADGIIAVGDCYFTVGNAVAVNGDGGTYYYTVMWDD